MTIRTTSVIFCDEEHGIGEVTFPPIDELAASDFVLPRSAKMLRDDARAAGWTFTRRGAWCPQCSHTDPE